MFVHNLPFLPLFRKHMRAPPVDFVPSPELYAPVEGRHRRPTTHRHMRLLQMVSELWRLLQVVVKRLSQRPSPRIRWCFVDENPTNPWSNSFSAPRTSPRLIARTCSRSKCRICPRTLFAMGHLQSPVRASGSPRYYTRPP